MSGDQRENICTKHGRYFVACRSCDEEARDLKPLARRHAAMFELRQKRAAA